MRPSAACDMKVKCLSVLETAAISQGYDPWGILPEYSGRRRESGSLFSRTLFRMRAAAVLILIL